VAEELESGRAMIVTRITLAKTGEGLFALPHIINRVYLIKTIITEEAKHCFVADKMILSLFLHKID